MKRRDLDCRSFQQLRADAAQMRGCAYRRAGTWSLGQNCEHIAVLLEQSIDGFEAKVAWYLRMGGPMAKRWLIWTRRMPAGVAAPPSFLPADTTDDDAGVERLMVAIDRYLAYDGPMQPSPLFGKMSRAEWDQIHLIHASHHLSFIVPDFMPAASRADA